MSNDADNQLEIIDREKLETAFVNIGKEKIVYYARLFLKNNRNFPDLLNKYIKNSSWDQLYRLIHKLKGSAANFYCSDLIFMLQQAEDKLLQKTGFDQIQDFTAVLQTYHDFCRELKLLIGFYSREVK